MRIWPFVRDPESAYQQYRRWHYWPYFVKTFYRKNQHNITIYFPVEVLGWRWWMSFVPRAGLSSFDTRSPDGRFLEKYVYVALGKLEVYHIYSRTLLPSWNPKQL